MAAATPRKMITLKSSDNQTFVVEESVALQSKTLEHMIADNDNENIVIPLIMITGSVFAKVVEYCTKHAEVETSDEDKRIWDAQFVNCTNSQMFVDMIMAANFLNITGLLDLTAQKVADCLEYATPEEILRAFNILNEITPEEEEEEEIRRANPWASE
ncbi:hypothetical protein MKW94_025856 [Papaver nudicaule]|uniref:SKP1-like protein n=1 Tax=Papaver nudicaule TaxID=74823 RepID=A0AA41V1F4_PAPNU|nr:hypothetical protein [Papaver nudicaule]